MDINALVVKLNQWGFKDALKHPKTTIAFYVAFAVLRWGGDCARYRGCSGQLADDLCHRQRSEGQMMPLRLSELEQLAEPCSIQSFIEILDQLWGSGKTVK